MEKDKTFMAANVIGLLRVSTDGQDVARQRADLERMKTKFGIHVTRVLELIGVSGTSTLEHTHIQQILKDLELPDIDGLAISSLDRLFRPKAYAAFGILDPFVKAGKRIWSAREGEINPGDDRGFDLCISAGGRAGAEWRELKRRTLDGRIEHLRSGKLDHGVPPYGYTYIPKWQPNGCRFEIHPERSQVVRDIFEWRRAGTPIYQICKKLNAAGILSAGQNGKPGGLWSRQVIQQLLKKPAYKGQHERFGIVVPVPAIVDIELWSEVQLINEQARQRFIGRPSRKYLLRGYLYCGKCGRRVITYPNHDRPHYRCGNFTAKWPFTRHCDAPSVGQAVIEAAAWAEIWMTLTNPKLLLELARAFYESQQKQNCSDSLQNELSRLKAKLEKTQAMVQDGLLEYAQGRTEIRSLQVQIKEKETEIRAAGNVVDLPPLAAAEADIRRMFDDPEVQEPTTFEGRRSILEGILDLRMTYDAGDLTIEGKIPMPAAESTTSGQKKCNSRVDATCISFSAIPFILKRRVA